MKWIVELDFAHRNLTWSPDWDGFRDTVSKEFMFDNIADALTLHHEAMAIIEAGFGGPHGDDPSEAMLDFVCEHDVQVFDIHGEPIGGFKDGVAIGSIELALLSVIRVVEVQDLTLEWQTEWAQDQDGEADAH
jgi:hypothetical protein